MATTKREISTSVKEMRGTSPSNSKPSQRKPSSSSTVSSSSEKQLPNYLKPTKSSRTEAALKNLKKPAPEDPSQNPNILRRRSFDRPPSAARAHKALISPIRHKAAATSQSSKSATAPKAPLERVARKPNAAAKPQTQRLSSSRSLHKTPTTSTKSKRGTSTTPSASKKPPSSPDRKEAQSVETKHENKENLDQQVEPEEVVKDDQGEIDDTKILKAEESGNMDAVAVAVDVDTTEVISVVDEGGQDAADISDAISEQHNEPEPQTETEKVEEDKAEEGKSDDTQHDDGDKENPSQEEIIVGDDHQQEKTPHEDQEAKTETELGGEEYATEENDEGSQLLGLESSKEETVQELDAEQEPKPEPEAETEAEAANVVAKSQVQGKKESATPYNDVIEETASKLLLEERKNKVRALVGAFETVIDKETYHAK